MGVALPILRPNTGNRRSTRVAHLGRAKRPMRGALLDCWQFDGHFFPPELVGFGLAIAAL